MFPATFYPTAPQASVERHLEVRLLHGRKGLCHHYMWLLWPRPLGGTGAIASRNGSVIIWFLSLSYMRQVGLIQQKERCCVIGCNMELRDASCVSRLDEECRPEKRHIINPIYKTANYPMRSVSQKSTSLSDVAVPVASGPSHCGKSGKLYYPGGASALHPPKLSRSPSLGGARVEDNEPSQQQLPTTPNSRPHALLIDKRNSCL